MFVGGGFNNDEFSKTLKTILTVAEALGRKISTFIETSNIDFKRLPPPEKWTEIYVQHTDFEVANTISQMGQQGWLFYDLVNFLPLTDLYHVFKQAEAASSYQSVNPEMISAFEVALDEGTGLGGFDSLASAIRDVDPVGAEKRISYLEQMLNAYKTTEMYALIPPMAYAQLESLFGNFSHQQGLRSADTYVGIYDKRRARKFISDIQTSTLVEQSGNDTGFVLHKSFLEHLKVFENELTKLGKSSTTYDYVKTEDIERKAFSPSRHYVAHGGLGVDTQIHAVKAITTLIAAIFLLQKIKIFKTDQMVE